MAIRIGRLEDSALVARQIGGLQPMVVASPAYLAAYGAPGKPAELEAHTCLPFLFEGASKSWKFRETGAEIEILPQSRFRTNDTDSILAAVRSGMGLAQGLSWIFEDDIAAGTLVSVLDGYRADLIPLNAVTTGRRRTTSAIRTFVDFVEECVVAQPKLRRR